MGNNDDFNDEFDFGDEFDDDFDTLADDSSGAGTGGLDDFDGFEDLDDDFGFGDEGDDFGFGDEGDDFSFEDEGDDFSFDNELGGEDLGEYDDLDFGGGEDDFTGEDAFLEEDENDGASPGFMRWVAILGGLFLAQLIAILLLFLLGGPSGPTDIQLTSTAVVQINATTFAEGTARAGTSIAQQATIDAAGSVTPTPTETATNTPRPTFTPEPTIDATEQELTAVAQAQSANATSTAAAEQTADAVTPTATELAIDIEGTRSALATTFANITATFAARTPMDDDLEQGGGSDTGDATPTQEGAIPGGAGAGGGNVTTELPDAGLFDDFAALNSLGLIALAAFGLLGVIMFSRRIRSQNTRDE